MLVPWTAVRWRTSGHTVDFCDSMSGGVGLGGDLLVMTSSTVVHSVVAVTAPCVWEDDVSSTVSAASDEGRQLACRGAADGVGMAQDRCLARD